MHPRNVRQLSNSGQSSFRAPPKYSKYLFFTCIRLPRLQISTSIYTRSTKYAARYWSKTPNDGRGRPTMCVFQLAKAHKYLQTRQATHPTVENVCFYRKQNKFLKPSSQFERTRKVNSLGGEIWVLLAASVFWLISRCSTLAFPSAKPNSLICTCDTRSVV